MSIVISECTIMYVQGDKMDVASDSSEDEDVDEFRCDMDIDEHRFLVLCFTLLLIFIIIIISLCDQCSVCVSPCWGCSGICLQWGD